MSQAYDNFIAATKHHSEAVERIETLVARLRAFADFGRGKGYQDY
jgi:hypothetical protein